MDAHGDLTRRARRRGRTAAADVTSPAPREAWAEVARADPDVLVTQTAPWVDALCAGGDWGDASRLYETRGGNRIVLPLVRRRGPWPEAVAPRASMPHAWGMGGLIAERPPTPDDVDAVIADLRTDGAVSTRVRPNPLHAERWRVLARDSAKAVPGVAHVLDLEGGEERVWAERLSKDARRRVRRAQRMGVEVECDSTGRLVPVFTQLLGLSVARWAAQQHEPLALARWRAQRRDPPHKFARIAASLGDSCKVWVAWHEGRPAAAMVVLRGRNASDARAAMDKAIAGPTSATALLQWMSIVDACRAGCPTYHLGETAPGSSLAHAKEKFGARPVPYETWHLERLPMTRVDRLARTGAKRLLRVKDA